MLFFYTKIHEYAIMRNEKRKTFVYQTCLNFVNTYSNLILNNGLKEETKVDLIVEAFRTPNFHRNLLRVNDEDVDYVDGYYITIDLYETRKDL